MTEQKQFYSKYYTKTNSSHINENGEEVVSTWSGGYVVDNRGVEPQYFILDRESKTGEFKSVNEEEYNAEKERVHTYLNSTRQSPMLDSFNRELERLRLENRELRSRLEF